MRIVEWFRRMIGRPPTAVEVVPSPAPVDDPDGPVWCVVANVLRERPHGPGGAKIRPGTKHFAPGAKVHAIDFFWGSARVTVVWRHRKSKRYMTIVMNAAHLADWRAELVYSPHVIEQVLQLAEFSRLPRGVAGSRSRAEEIAAGYIDRGSKSQPYNTRPPTS